MKSDKALESHFANHWLPWLALYHFLPVFHLREVVCGMIQFMSRGELTLNQLFDEQVTDSNSVSEAWVITPKPATTPLASYLQDRIRFLVWGNDASASFDPASDWSGLSVHPTLVEAVVSFGNYSNAASLARALDLHGTAEFPELSALVHCIETLSQSISEEVSELTDAIENTVTKLEMPLRAAALKFAGDCAALNDEWCKAKTIYDRVLVLLVKEKNQISDRLLSSLTAVTAQSLATASRVLEGNKCAASIYDRVHDRWPNVDPILYSVNASHESWVAHFSESAWPDDNRTSLLAPPLLIKTHDIEKPILDFLESDFSAANQKFHSRLRRQIALGSSLEARITKAAYARSIFSALVVEHQKRRDKAEFSIATRFLIESAMPKLVSSIEWDKDLIDFYVDAAMIQQVYDRSAAFDGVRTERQIVVIELLSGWAVKLSSDKKAIAALILEKLAQLAMQNQSTSNTSTNIGGRSLKALVDIAAHQPEWRTLASRPVAKAVATRLNTPGEWWTGKQQAAETATIYASAFADDDIDLVIKAAVNVLEQIDSGFWLVINPIQKFLCSVRAKKFIQADQALERRVIELLFRQGAAQGGDQANLIHCLRVFDSGLLEDAELKTRLHELIEGIKEKAGMVNNSGSTTNIRALLSVPGLAGLKGVDVALESIKKILQSIDSSLSSISLSVAYYPLLQIAVEHERIATGIGLSNEEFLHKLNPLADLLENLWKHAADDPTIFVPFSIPPSHVPDSVMVHNWTFASIQFAKLLGNTLVIEGAINSAAQAQPSIAKAIARAKLIQELSSGEESFDEEKVKESGKEAFYLNVGSLLSQIDASSEEGQARCQFLLQMCLQHGPNDLDMAVFIRSQQCGLVFTVFEPAAISAYIARLNNNSDRRLNFMPLLKQLGYREE